MVTALAGPFVQQDGVTIQEGALNATYHAHLSVRARNLGATGVAGPGLTGTLVPLDPGVQKELRFSLGPEDFSFYGRDLQPVIEPGSSAGQNTRS